MVEESNKNVFLIQTDASSFAEFEISELEISRVDYTSSSIGVSLLVNLLCHISETWPCKSAKGKKKKHSCCCSDIKSKTCKQHLKEAKVFETKLKKETAVKTCNQDNDYPCDCEGKKGKSG